MGNGILEIKTYLMRSWMVVVLLFYSCSGGERKLSHIDSLERDIRISEIADSLDKSLRNQIQDARFAASDATSPVKVIKCRLSKDEHGAKQIEVTVKNITKRTIDGIKIGWQLENNFNEKVGVLSDGGTAQEIMSAGKTATYYWDCYEQGATKIRAYIHSVHFKDGETWIVTTAR